jgi:hypothetical protein
MGKLGEQAGLRVQCGKRVSALGVEEYAGDSAGVSIIDADSLDEALERVRACPGLPLGWTFDVLHE